MPLPSLTASTSLRPSAVPESGLPNGDASGLVAAATVYAIAELVDENGARRPIGCGKGSSEQSALKKAQKHAEGVVGDVVLRIANKAEYTQCRHVTRGRDQNQAFGQLGF